MDDYIDNELCQKSFDEANLTGYMVFDENSELVAVFAVGESLLEVDEDLKEDLSYSSDFVGNLIESPCNFKTIDIGYLVVRENRRGRGIGSWVISEIRKRVPDDVKFITVDAVKGSEYSAVPFYYKLGFYAAELPDPCHETLRMYRPVYAQ